MAGDQHIGKRQQTGEHIVANDGAREVFEEQIGLFFVNIDPERTQLPRFERPNNGLRVDNPAATGVDQHHARLHAGDRLIVDQVMGLRHERTVQRDDVRFGKQGRQIDIGGSGRFTLRVGLQIIGQHPTAKSPCNLTHAGTDAAGADHANGATVQVKPQHALQTEVAFTHPRIGFVQPTVQRQDQGKRVLGHGVRRVGGHAGDRDSQLGRGFQINVVKPRTAEHDHLQPVFGQQCEDFPVQHIVHKHADGRIAKRQGSGRHGQPRFKKRELVPRGDRCERILVIAFGAEEGGLHRLGFCVREKVTDAGQQSAGVVPKTPAARTGWPIQAGDAGPGLWSWCEIRFCQRPAPCDHTARRADAQRSVPIRAPVRGPSEATAVDCHVPFAPGGCPVSLCRQVRRAAGSCWRRIRSGTGLAECGASGWHLPAATTSLTRPSDDRRCRHFFLFVRPGTPL